MLKINNIANLFTISFSDVFLIAIRCYTYVTKHCVTVLNEIQKKVEESLLKYSKSQCIRHLIKKLKECSHPPPPPPVWTNSDGRPRSYSMFRTC